MHKSIVVSLVARFVWLFTGQAVTPTQPPAELDSTTQQLVLRPLSSFENAYAARSLSDLVRRQPPSRPKFAPHGVPKITVLPPGYGDGSRGGEARPMQDRAPEKCLCLFDELWAGRACVSGGMYAEMCVQLVDGPTPTVHPDQVKYDDDSSSSDDDDDEDDLIVRYGYCSNDFVCAPAQKLDRDHRPRIVCVAQSDADLAAEKVIHTIPLHDGAHVRAEAGSSSTAESRGNAATRAARGKGVLTDSSAVDDADDLAGSSRPMGEVSEALKSLQLDSTLAAVQRSPL